MAAAHAEALDRFLALGGDDLEPRGRQVAARVGTEPGLLAGPLHALSGGQRARAALAAILLSRFDVLLLDEPTNDLDFDGLALLEDFLAGTWSALVVVSHDRELLDRVATRIVEVEENGTGIRGGREAGASTSTLAPGRGGASTPSTSGTPPSGGSSRSRPAA